MKAKKKAYYLEHLDELKAKKKAYNSRPDVKKRNLKRHLKLAKERTNFLKLSLFKRREIILANHRRLV